MSLCLDNESYLGPDLSGEIWLPKKHCLRFVLCNVCVFVNLWVFKTINWCKSTETLIWRSNPHFYDFCLSDSTIKPIWDLRYKPSTVIYVRSCNILTNLVTTDNAERIQAHSDILIYMWNWNYTTNPVKPCGNFVNDMLGN